MVFYWLVLVDIGMLVQIMSIVNIKSNNVTRDVLLPNKKLCFYLDIQDLI